MATVWGIPHRQCWCIRTQETEHADELKGYMTNNLPVSPTPLTHTCNNNEGLWIWRRFSCRCTQVLPSSSFLPSAASWTESRNALGLSWFLHLGRQHAAGTDGELSLAASLKFYLSMRSSFLIPRTILTHIPQVTTLRQVILQWKWHICQGRETWCDCEDFPRAFGMIIVMREQR